MLYLAIDQHRKQLTVNLRNEEGDVLLRRQVSTQWDKVREFFDALRRQSGDGGFLAILEVCGFNDWLLEMLTEYGCKDVVLVHPTKRASQCRPQSGLLSARVGYHQGRRGFFLAIPVPACHNCQCRPRVSASLSPRWPLRIGRRGQPYRWHIS